VRSKSHLSPAPKSAALPKATQLPLSPRSKSSAVPKPLPVPLSPRAQVAGMSPRTLSHQHNLLNKKLAAGPLSPRSSAIHGAIVLYTKAQPNDYTPRTRAGKVVRSIQIARSRSASKSRSLSRPSSARAATKATATSRPMTARPANARHRVEASSALISAQEQANRPLSPRPANARHRVEASSALISAQEQARRLQSARPTAARHRVEASSALISAQKSAGLTRPQSARPGKKLQVAAPVVVSARPASASGTPAASIRSSARRKRRTGEPAMAGLSNKKAAASIAQFYHSQSVLSALSPMDQARYRAAEAAKREHQLALRAQRAQAALNRKDSHNVQRKQNPQYTAYDVNWHNPQTSFSTRSSRSGNPSSRSARSQSPSKRH
jgi:hypothetical protein